LKLLFLITRGELGGGQRHVVDLLEGLRRRYQVELGTGEDGYLVEQARALGVPVHLIPHLKMPMAPFEDLRGLAEVSQLIARVRPDLVHAHTSKAGILGRMAARMNGVPCLFTAHTWCFAEGTSWKWKAIGIPLEKLAARWSGAIVNVSEANRQLALRHGIASAEKLLTIHNGIPDSPHRAQPGEGGVPRVVMIARFAPQKAQAELIRAIQGIEEPLTAVFVGDGPTRGAHEALAADLGVASRVEFLGERRDIDAILATAHVFALPTNWEGFPLTILEGMRAGLPVVASNVGGVAEAIVEGRTGFLTPAGSTGEFRARLRSLVADRELRRRMGAAGRERYEREFTVEAMLEKTVAVYQSIWARENRRVLHPAAAAAKARTARTARPARIEPLL
jgi:glycosyltransferase involved in cell wall biosynthesis